MLTSSTALQLVAGLGAVGVAVGSAERLARPQLLRDDGLAGWAVAGTGARFMGRGLFRHTVGPVLAYPRILGLIAACLGCAVLLALGGISPAVDALAAAVIAATLALLNLRSRFGTDGADQLSLITFAAVALAFGLDHPQASVLVLWFLAAQGCLAYVTAGLAKVASAAWRSGTALPEILATRAYGNPLAARVLAPRPQLSRLLCWSVIVLECAFPLALLGVAPLTYALLLGAGLFHLGTAVLMRLNTFLWSFVALYPAIVFCAVGS